MSTSNGDLQAREGGWSCFSGGFSFVGPIFPAFSEDTQGEDSDQPLDVFVLAGQSNMAGRGGVLQTKSGLTWDGDVPPPCQQLPGKILKYTAAGTWETAREPLHQDIDSTKICGVGPGMPFANELLRMGYKNCIGLVPCAIGGTRVDLWEEGGKLFTNMIHRTLASLSERPNSRLCGILWFQGESDADIQERAAAYNEKCTRLFQAMREGLNVPSLPIVQVAVTSTRDEVPHIDVVRKGQFAIDLPNLVTVDARGYHLPDGFHLSTYAQCKLAKEMAEAYSLNFGDSSPAQEMDAPPVDAMGKDRASNP